MSVLRTYPDYRQAGNMLEELEDRSKGYLASYPKIIAAVSMLKDDDQGNALALVAHAAYGWMPTVLSAGCFEDGFMSEKDPILKIRKCRSASEIMSALPGVSPINNSWVGLSKVLHFINPEVFPIWDGRVARHFGLMHPYQYNTKQCYEEYAAWIEKWSKENDFKDLICSVHKAYGYKMTHIRAAELYLFLSEVGSGSVQSA